MSTSEKDTSVSDPENGIHAPVPVATHDEVYSTPPAPDGGLTAWLQVVAAHFALINTWGILNSYGIFQAYYVGAFNRSASDISWIGSLETCLVFAVGTFSGRAVDSGYLRHVITLGLFLVVLGTFMTSLATQYWHLVLAQGICQGLGCGLVFCPIIALISTYFSKRRSLAIALQACGGGTGGMIYPAIAQSLLPRIGFPWTMRVMGLVTLCNAVVVLALIRERRDLPPRKRSMPIVDWAAFREPPYLLFSVGAFLLYLGVYFAYFYIRPYARTVLHESDATSFSLLLVLNGIGIPGRIIPALLADRFLGPVNTFIPTVLVSGVLLYAWIGVSTDGSMWAFAVLYGYFGAGVQSLFPASLSSLTDDLSKIGVRIGMVFTVVSIACLIGPPIGGSLIDSHQGNYLAAQVFGGTAMVAGAICLFAARTAKHGFVLVKRM